MAQLLSSPMACPTFKMQLAILDAYDDGGTSMVLPGSGITGCIPTELGTVTTLTVLDLKENHLQSTIPTELGMLTALESGSGDGWSASEGLLQWNLLTGTIPSQLGQFSRMRTVFSLGGNKITGTLPTQLGQLTQLINGLNVYGNYLSEYIATEIGRLSLVQENVHF
jgi:hypothetical protein